MYGVGLTSDLLLLLKAQSLGSSQALIKFKSTGRPLRLTMGNRAIYLLRSVSNPTVLQVMSGLTLSALAGESGYVDLLHQQGFSLLYLSRRTSAFGGTDYDSKMEQLEEKKVREQQQRMAGDALRQREVKYYTALLINRHSIPVMPFHRYANTFPETLPGIALSSVIFYWALALASIGKFVIKWLFQFHPKWKHV